MCCSNTKTLPDPRTTTVAALQHNQHRKGSSPQSKTSRWCCAVLLVVLVSGLSSNSSGEGTRLSRCLFLLHLPDYAKGYLTFVISILGIGLLTAFIGDLASHFGCTIGLKDSITAIAFVALGTSVPGTLWLFGSASRVAPLPRRGATGKPEISQQTTVSLDPCAPRVVVGHPRNDLNSSLSLYKIVLHLLYSLTHSSCSDVFP